MTRDQIIQQLFTGQNFRDAIQKMEPAHLRDDLQMEVIAEVCEWPDEKVMDLHGRGRLGFYVAKVMLFMVINKYSPFYKKYRASVAEYVDDWNSDDKDHMHEGDAAGPKRRLNAGVKVEIEDIQVREIRELQEDAAMGLIDNLYWYDQQLIKLYIQHGSYRAIEGETGIPWESAYKSIQKSLKNIRCQVLKSSSVAS